MASVDWEQGEELLLEFPRVRHKKKDGVFYITNRRVAWTEYDASDFKLTHYYSEIKGQKISPDTKSKVQLQLVLHNGSAENFHFTNESTPTSAKTERDSAKELLQQLLTQQRSAPSRELEEKSRLLQEDPSLHQLYKDLVGSKVMTPDEFWESRLAQNSVLQTKQQAGVSSAFLASLQPQIDGCNSVRYNLDADTIASIFKTYPAVKRKYQEYVPDKLSEVQFWTQFFQSQYFHRDRLGAGSATKGKADMFSECAKQDESAHLKSCLASQNNPLLDLSSHPAQLDDGYGLVSEMPAPARSGRSSTSSRSAYQPMIRRFNHHSLMILSSTKLDGNGAQAGQETAEPASKRPQTDNTLREAVLLPDLESDKEVKRPCLQIKDIKRFTEGPTVAPTSASLCDTNTDTQRNAGQLFVRHLSEPSNNLLSAITVDTAQQAFLSLASGEWPGRPQQPQQDTGLTSEQMCSELHRHYLAVSELLRHFWSCFPVRSKQLEDKLTRMASCLESYQRNQLHSFQVSIAREDNMLSSHLLEMIQAALDKFTAWQARQNRRKP